MSSLVKCDKCDRTGEASEFMHIRAYKMTSATSYSTVCENNIDVCVNCYLKIFKESEDK